MSQPDGVPLRAGTRRSRPDRMGVPGPCGSWQVPPPVPSPNVDGSQAQAHLRGQLIWGRLPSGAGGGGRLPQRAPGRGEWAACVL